jgi:type I restriction enzyme R subunit
MKKTLREAHDQPIGSLMDFIRAALGMYRFPTREERIERNFQAWVASRSLNPDQAKMLRLLRNRFLAGEQIDIGIFNEDSTFKAVGGRRKIEQLFGADSLRTIVDELNASVFNT